MNHEAAKVAQAILPALSRAVFARERHGLGARNPLAPTAGKIEGLAKLHVTDPLYMFDESRFSIPVEAVNECHFADFHVFADSEVYAT